MIRGELGIGRGEHLQLGEEVHGRLRFLETLQRVHDETEVVAPLRSQIGSLMDVVISSRSPSSTPLAEVAWHKIEPPWRTGTTRSTFETEATRRAAARGTRARMCAIGRTSAQWARRAFKHLIGRGLVDAKARMRRHLATNNYMDGCESESEKVPRMPKNAMKSSKMLFEERPAPSSVGKRHAASSLSRLSIVRKKDIKCSGARCKNPIFYILYSRSMHFSRKYMARENAKKYKKATR